jgi:glycine/D-amino acid oxidase-like deaminating enzyme
VQTVPYWLDYPYEPRPALDLDVICDVCVIGAGVGGLSCARELARRGMNVLVLERRTVASGASGRNGGFLLAGGAPFHLDAREQWGHEPAKRLYARTVEAQKELIELAASLGVADAMRPVGSLRLATSEDEADHLRRHVEALREDGFAAELVERQDLAPALRDIGHAGCLVDHDAALHPARWIRALAADAEAAGARIFENTQARWGPPVSGNGFEITARHTVIAADSAVPAVRGDVRARRLHMVATAPLPDGVTDNLVYARWGYEYFQQLPDGRIALGGFSDLDGELSYTDAEEGNPEVWSRLERYLHEDLGLGGAEITHRWVGIVGFSHDQRPFAGALDNGLYALGGYSGHGNLIGFMAGRGVAEQIATGTSDDLELLALKDG